MARFTCCTPVSPGAGPAYWGTKPDLVPICAVTVAPVGIPVAKICRIVPEAAGADIEFTLLSWFRTPLPKMAGQAGASCTVTGALLVPFTVTTKLAVVLLATAGGTCRLIWLALV